MRVYHSSVLKVEKPLISYSRDFLDFGKGFYVTTILSQAEKYAERFKFREKDALLNIFEFDYDVHQWNVIKFEAYNEDWLDFVMDCRNGKDPQNADLVIGGIADDKVFRTIDLYFSNEINKSEALKRLVYEKPDMQICIKSQRLIDECLTFVDAMKL